MLIETNTLETYMGIVMDPLNPKIDDIDIIDITQALARQCRYGGHVISPPYSVAQHSVYVCDALPDRLKLWGLLHDASEAYLIDLPRPIKHETKLGELYEEIEGRIMAVIARRFNLPTLSVEDEKLIKTFDNRVMVTEKRDLRRKTNRWKIEEDYEVMPYTITAWPYDMAISQFIARYQWISTIGYYPPADYPVYSTPVAGNSAR